MRYNGAGKKQQCVACALLWAAISLVVAGCAPRDEEISIQPLPAVESRSDPGLGPGTRPLSSGPGYKGSPSWSPQGGRIAFTMDGYVVDKSVTAGDHRRWTTRNLGAEEAEWTSESSLMILAADSTGPSEASKSVYRTRSEEGSPAVEEVTPNVLAMSPSPEGEDLVALETGSHDSVLVLMSPDGKIDRVYSGTIEGHVTSISFSPDSRKAALAVRTAGGRGPFGLHVFDLREGDHRRIARLDEGLDIFGAPQWTERGTYYVAGREEAPGDESAALYDLYHVPPGSDTPEAAPGVGKDFVAASIRVSPDGRRLAVIGRLNPQSPTNLYVLDLAAEELEVVTTNEDMEIKTGQDDLAWSPSGESVVIVARGALSGEPIVHAAPANSLLEEFYNLYEVPVGDQGSGPR
jgi:Tol biopolymer transport system component